MNPSIRQTLAEIGNHSLPYRDLKDALVPSKFDAKAAVCVLFRGHTFEDAEVLLTLRTDQVLTHRSQVAFPGGACEPEDQNDVTRTALRECEEEVGLKRHEIEGISVLPRAFTLAGNVEVFPILGWIATEHSDSLRLDPREVQLAEWVKVSELRKSFHLEKRMAGGVEIEAPVYLWGSRKMWGLSAWIFDLILRRYDTLSS